MTGAEPVAGARLPAAQGGLVLPRGRRVLLGRRTQLSFYHRFTIRTQRLGRLRIAYSMSVSEFVRIFFLDKSGHYQI
jgi:hypothetical protein